VLTAIIAFLRASKRPPVRVKVTSPTYRSAVASRGGGFLLPASAEVREAQCSLPSRPMQRYPGPSPLSTSPEPHTQRGSGSCSLIVYHTRKSGAGRTLSSRRSLRHMESFG